LPSQRWFGDKSRTIARVSPIDQAPVPDTSGALALFRVEFTEGPAEIYCVPMAPAGDGRRDAGFADPIDNPAFCSALVERMRQGASLSGRSGTFRFASTPALAEVLPGPPEKTARVAGEQSNTSVVFDQRAILKIVRRVEPGMNPELEITEFLTRATSFRGAPRLAGSIQYESSASEPLILGIMQEFVQNQGDAWTALQVRLGEYFSVAVIGPDAGGSTDPAFARALAAADAKEARALGEVTGRLHMALASATSPESMAPAPAEAADVAGWRERMRAQLDRALAALKAALDTLSADQRQLAQQALERAPQLAERLVALDVLAQESVQKIRVHGDYHLGQVLRTDGGFVVVDFEGEPAHSLGDRRARECAVKDVAGMLRSYSYASSAAVLRAADAAPGDPGLIERLRPWATSWEEGVRTAFLEGYLAETSLRGARFLPRSREAFDRVLTVYELDKAIYELEYELNHRPGWARIPLAELVRAGAPPAAAPAPAARATTEGPFRFVACVELREFVGQRAEDERQLMELIEQVSLDSIYYHTHAFFLRHKFLAGIYPNDFATWVAVHVRDQMLGEQLAMMDPGEFENLEALRNALASLIDDHLRRLTIVPRIVSAEPFDFVRSRIVEIPTGVAVTTLEEFRQALLEVDASAIYFHLVEARVRLGGDNDFTAWLDRAVGQPKLAARIRGINPYSGSLERTRSRLIQRCDEALAEGPGA